MHVECSGGEVLSGTTTVDIVHRLGRFPRVHLGVGDHPARLTRSVFRRGRCMCTRSRNPVVGPRSPSGKARVHREPEPVGPRSRGCTRTSTFRNQPTSHLSPHPSRPSEPRPTRGPELQRTRLTPETPPHPSVPNSGLFESIRRSTPHRLGLGTRRRSPAETVDSETSAQTFGVVRTVRTRWA